MIKELYQPRFLLRKQKLLGEVPSAKEAYGRMFKMAFPSTVEALLGGLTSFVDTLMVSSLGISSVTAVGITTQPRMIILMLFMALNTGVTALVARRKGENDAKKANQILMQALLICFILAIIMTAVGLFTAKPLLRFAGAGDDFIDDAVMYYNIVTAGTVFSVLTMTINAAQRGAGNTKIAMTTNIASNVVNVIFNFLLIGGRLGFPALGVKGAAIATVIVTWLSVMIYLIQIAKVLKLKLLDFFPIGKITKNALVTIISLFLSFLIIWLGKQNLLFVAIGGIVFILSYLLLGRKTGVILDYDVQLAKELINDLKGKFKK